MSRSIPNLVRIVLLTLLVVLLPFRKDIYLGASGSTPIFVSILDLIGLALTGLAAFDLVARTRGHPDRRLRWAAVLFLVLYWVAWAIHPSAEGCLRALRVTEVVAIAVAFTRIDRGEAKVLLGAFAFSLLLETSLTVAQTIASGPVGLNVIGEAAQFPLRFPDGDPRVQGTFVHAYILAGFGLLAGAILLAGSTRARAWSRHVLVAFGSLAGVVTALTHSRMGLLALLGVAFALWLPPTRNVLAVAALLVAFVIPAFLTRDHWAVALKKSTPTFSEDAQASSSSSRLRYLGESIAVMADRPVFGVGPAMYVSYRHSVHPRGPDLEEPVHDVPLLIAAEAGIPSGLTCLALMVLLLALCLERRNRVGLVVFLSLAPFFAFDHFLYDDTQGIFLTALWAGGILLLSGGALRDVTEEPVNEAA